MSKVNKLDQAIALLGRRFAIQSAREIGKLQTYYPGQRSELDYTKYGIFLYPTCNWNEPQLYFTGFGIDHYSKVIKGYRISTAPAARDAIRLYRNCVLPKGYWLPENLKSRANEWDVFGLEEYVAIDNGMDLIANATILVFVIYGVIVLRMPPKRGDLKGSIERFNLSCETQFVSSQPGYIAHKEFMGLDEKHTRLRERTKANAKLTVAEYEAGLLNYILEHNQGPHPTLKKPRIQVWRDGQGHAPILLPTGEQQLRSSFALTYESTLTREGVIADGKKYNCPRLHEHYQTYRGKGIVKVDSDDIRTALVHFPDMNEPIEASLTNFEFDHPVSLELYDLVMKRLAATEVMHEPEDLSDRFATEINRLQTKSESRTQGTRPSADVQAATDAAAMPPVEPPKPKSAATLDLDALLGDSRLGPPGAEP